MWPPLTGNPVDFPNHEVGVCGRTMRKTTPKRWPSGHAHAIAEEKKSLCKRDEAQG